jgi:hypothetical protein
MYCSYDQCWQFAPCNVHRQKKPRQARPRFALFHVQVRNDDHCPSCRRFYVSFSDTPDQNLDNFTWEDEWVRRRNGDGYISKRIKCRQKYDLNDLSLLEKQYNNFRSTLLPKYMVIQIHVLRQEWCPENIQFYVTFFSGKKKAVKFCLNEIGIESISAHHTLYQGKPLFLGKKSGVYYHVVPIKNNDTLCLNDNCLQIQPDFWFS